MSPVVKFLIKEQEVGRSKLDVFKDVLHKWLVVEDDSYIDVMFGAVLSGRIDSDPLWMHVVGAPGAGKTEIVQAMDGHPSIYSISTFTPKTLASGIVPEPGEPDPSLLPTLNNKILCIKDFTAIMTMKADEVNTICGQLRDIYDGTFRACFGTGKQVRYDVKFGIITGVTHEIYKHSKVMSGLGARFLMYDLPFISKEERKKRVLCAGNSVGSKTKRVEEMRRAAHQVLRIRQRPVKITQEQIEILAEASEMAAKARTNILRSNSSMSKVKEAPIEEIPTRIMKQLVSLVKGIAMAREEVVISDFIMGLACKVALDSGSPRRKLPMLMLAEYEGKKVRPTAQILAKRLRLNPKTLALWLDDLHILGLVDKIQTGRSGNGPMTYAVVRRWLPLLRRIPNES